MSEFVEEMVGESVNEKRTDLMSDYLDPDEEPHFILKGKSVEIQRGDEEDRKSGKRTLTAITDDRILIVVFQRISGNDTRSIEYDSVDGINLDKGIVTKKMSVQVSGKTYRIHVLDNNDEINNAMKYIRNKKKETNQRSQGEDDSETLDPTKQLKNIKELHDEGVLTDEEFEEKKSELLDKI